MKALVIVNPTAGNGRAKRAARELAGFFDAAGMRCELCVTERPGHGTELAAAAAAGDFDGVVAVGGDGTVQEVVNGMKAVDIPLGVIPVGTGNDFARALAIPRKLREAVEIIAAGHCRQVDLGEVNGRRYVQVCGVGFDAQVAAAVSRNRERFPGGGVLPYLWGILQQLVTYRNADFTVTLDGVPEQHKALLIAAGNSRYYAGGLKICPEARIDDALLDVCIVGDLPLAQRVAVLRRVFSGTHTRHPRVTYRKASRLEVSGPPNLLIHADGQIIGHLPATVRVLPRAIRVFAPPQAPS